MIKRALGLAFIAACGFGSAAHAADLTVVEEAVVTATPVFNWTGFYAGVHGGYGWAKLDSADTGVLGGDKPDGFFGGGQLGYNYQFSTNVVLGVEADASFGNLKDSESWTVLAPIDLNVWSKLDAFGTVRGRVGYAADRFLPYLTGGLAWARAEQEISATANVQDTQFTLLSAGGTKTFTGWTVGAGLEYAITTNITAKVEYLYADLGSKDFSGLAAEQNIQYKGDLTMQTAKFGLNYKF
ncbi:MAG: porin family protein [Candidatus Kaistia colombiensis]|nr:MAG: porin family protein [Kaistia sp.]